MEWREEGREGGREGRREIRGKGATAGKNEKVIK